MSEFSYRLENGLYVIYNTESGERIKTPEGGNVITTPYEPLAKRIVRDLGRYGMDYHSTESVLAWHFSLLDRIEQMGHEGFQKAMENSFLRREDWTCRANYFPGWHHFFGDWDERIEYIRQWLTEATLMQMTAACCIGNAYESINVAFTLALVLEKYKDEARDRKLKELAAILSLEGSLGQAPGIYNDCKTFELYYGFHLAENGPIIKKMMMNCDDNWFDEVPDDDDDLDIDIWGGDTLDVNNLTQYNVSVEQLIGRNFYHYSNGEQDDEQPAMFEFADLDLDLFDDECEEDEDEANNIYEDEIKDNERRAIEELWSCLPEDCWVKRFVDDEDPNLCYLLYLVLDDDGNIENSGCIAEIAKFTRLNPAFAIVPGLKIPREKSYETIDFPPDKITDDLEMLFQGRSLPLDFSFVGKKLPQKMLDRGGNGGSSTEYTYALQSAYRLAYMHMSIYTDTNGIVDDFSYASYQSYGNAFGDMVTRPVSYSDRQDEALDMMLYLYDMYSEEELSDF